VLTFSDDVVTVIEKMKMTTSNKVSGYSVIEKGDYVVIKLILFVN